MSTGTKKNSFFNAEERAKIEETLRLMATDLAYNTKSSYSANSDLHPDNLVNFVDKHMSYLTSHPSVDPNHYVSNLRLMTRIR